MQELISIVQEDYGYNLNFTLTDSLGAIVNLTGATLTFTCQSASDGTINFSNPMVIVNPSLGTCLYTVQQNDFLTYGNFTAQISLNYSSNTEIVSFSGINIQVAPRLPQ